MDISTISGLNLGEILDALNVGAALPAIWLGLFTTMLLIADLFISNKKMTAWLALGGLLVAFIFNLFTFDLSNPVAFEGTYLADHFTGFLNIVILVTGVITIFLSMDYLKRQNIERGEFYALLLFSVTGMMFMTSANDLIVIFVALELLSIPLYVLSAFRPGDSKSEESGMKYFILGAFASAFFVYGAALVYGATGTTNLNEIFTSVAGIVQAETDAVFYLLTGTALLIVGLGFKVAVVPFHMWTPDVYEGAPTPVTAFMSVGAKAGGFGALLRIMVIALPAFVLNFGGALEPLLDGSKTELSLTTSWQTVLWIVAAATLFLGNFVAISQTNMKRMLAYSSIAHAGYILMAVAAAGSLTAINGENGVELQFALGDSATQAALVYLMAYMFTNLGAFGVVSAIEKDDGSDVTLEDFVGLAKSQPVLALMMMVFMFSLTGIPLTAGFTGKWLVFQATVEANLIPLAIIGVLTSVVSAFYYVRVIVNMYLREGDGAEAVGATPYVQWAIYASFAATVLMGVFPRVVTNLTDMVNVASVALIP